MSRRTFTRAAAGLVAAALGTTAPAQAQTPNPWRGEADVPTAPAPRPVTRHAVRVEISYRIGNHVGIEIVPQSRPAAALPVAPAPREAAAARCCVDLDIGTGACPLPTQFTAQSHATPAPAVVTFSYGEPAAPNTLKPLGTTDTPVASASPLKPTGVARTAAPAVQPAGYAAPAAVAQPRFMPPPAPLPVPLPRAVPAAPRADDLGPVQVEFAFPEKGVRPVRTPGSNVIPHGRPQALESVRTTSTPAAQGRQ